MSYKITVIPGDGIGKEITDSAVEVLKKVDEKFGLGLSYTYKDAGGTAYDKFGTPLPDDTIEACKASDGVLFGAVGGDKWDNVDPALRPEKAILGLRKNLGLYANLRPVKVADALVEYSPLKPELVKGVDLVIVRELIGGIYFGDKCESEQHNGAERAWDLENYSVPEVDRIAKLAFETAKLRRGSIPLYSDLTAEPYSENAAELLSQQICSPVLWEKLIRNMIDAGVDTFIEVGPGRTLTNMTAKIDPGVRALTALDIIRGAEGC